MLQLSKMCVCVMLVTAAISAQGSVYTTCGTGTWGSNAGSTTLRFSKDGGACNINPRDGVAFALVDGDEIIFASGHTITFTSEVVIDEEITFTVNGGLVFNNGKIRLTDPASTIELGTGSSMTCTSGDCGNNDQITIGTKQYKGQDLEDINNMPRPTSVTNTGALPIVLSEFLVSNINNTVLLSWKTLSEINFQKFVVQRSPDGNVYEDIDEVYGAGRDFEGFETAYSSKDLFPLLGFNYYRLKAIDLDGKYEYFGPKAIRILGEESFSVFPNPSRGKTLSFKVNFEVSSTDRVEMINEMGKCILNLSAKDFEAILSNNQIKSGTYLVRYTSAKNQFSTRISVQD
jgi:hypothetical protein